MNPLNDPPTLTEQVSQMLLENAQYHDMAERNYAQTIMIQERDQAILDLNDRIISLIKGNDTHTQARRDSKKVIGSLIAKNKVRSHEIINLREVTTAIDKRCTELQGENDILAAKNAVLERSCTRFFHIIRSKMRLVTTLRRDLQAKSKVIIGIKAYINTHDRGVVRKRLEKKNRLNNNNNG